MNWTWNVRILTAAFALFTASAAFGADRWTIGLTSNDERIEAIVISGPSPSAPTVLLLSGLQGKETGVDIVTREAEAFDAIPQARRPFRLIALPLANPEGRPLQFPPTGNAYKENADSHVIWRWIGIHAPDLVIIEGSSDSGLADALSQNAVAFVGRIPAQLVMPRAGLLKTIPDKLAPSEAHLEIDRRRSRSPQVFAAELAKVYGRDFNQPTYIQAMALIGRLRLGQTADVAALAEPYLSGSKDSFAAPSQSSLAAHMFFFELAKRTRDERAAKLVTRAANSGFTETGGLKEFMPLNGGWSDSVFMDIPILAKAGALTGERKYFDMAARHLRYMQKIVLRPDGLYRHQASTDAAWGRGNGFPALGLALTLSDFPKDHPDYSWMVKTFQDHMKALSRFQDENGMWREVVDYPGAYPEYSGTAMIATAMLRGIRNGWLDPKVYQPLVDNAWQAILARTASDGRVLDVAESTGTRGLTFKDYLRRAAILDRDARAGAFAMIFATELAGLQ
ncbi:MAG TPA: glycoside hydrolase family 88 protein [Terriglobia bacterium]|jgi:rhamnogalacturonyl hydrolase YesR